MAPIKNYTPHQMGCALEAVRRGESVTSAAKKYGVPRITLRNKFTGKSPAVCSMGPVSILSNAEENILVQWLFAMSERHCPVAKEQLLDSVQLIINADKRETPFTEGRPGRKWFQSFLKRHPDVSQRLAQNLTTSREAVTQDQITKWFHEVHEYIKENHLEDVLKDPKRIFNADESAFFLNPNPGHVLVKKGDKHVYSVSENEKENLTVLVTANGAGQLAPPMIVFAYERVPKHVADSIPDSWAIGKSENGWMCASTFYEYIANVFHPWLIKNKIELPVISFLDGHASHLTKHLSDFCSENKIELIALYPNSTHILQPMDLAVFKPLKVFWRKNVRKWKSENLGQQVKKDNFAAILKCALEDLSPDSVRNGFRAGGLFPFGPDYIDFSKMHTLNRKLANDNQPLSSQDADFFAKLEKEIVNIFTQSKLDMYQKLFYVPRTSLNEELPAEDLSLYTIWAKYKHKFNSNTVEQEPLTYALQSSEKSRDVGEFHECDDALIPNEINQQTPSLSEPSPSHNNHNNDTFIIPTSNNTFQEPNVYKTPTKPTATPSFAELMKDKNITVPSPFKAALFWPEHSNNKIRRMPKQKLPSAITSKAWKEFHEKKEIEKKTKEMEKEKRKQERLDKKNNKKQDIQLKGTKRKKRPVTSSSESEDSDITYAETDESDNGVESDNLLTEVLEMELRNNDAPEETVKNVNILENVGVEMILDDETGNFKLIPEQKQSGPVVGNYVLVKFDTKNTKKVYRYVCLIQEVYEDKLVVQGLQSRKSKDCFKVIENDISIINEADILCYLPHPERDIDNNSVVFPYVIDIKELK